MNQPEIDFHFDPQNGVIGFFSAQQRALAGGKTNLSVLLQKDGRSTAYFPRGFIQIESGRGLVSEEIERAELTAFEAASNEHGLQVRLFLVHDFQKRFIAYKVQVFNKTVSDMVI